MSRNDAVGNEMPSLDLPICSLNSAQVRSEREVLQQSNQLPKTSKHDPQPCIRSASEVKVHILSAGSIQLELAVKLHPTNASFQLTVSVL